MSVTAGLSESAPRIGTVDDLAGAVTGRGTERRTAGVEDATGADGDQPRAVASR